ncbi:MAG: D-3-phosphoglycerate dehydrogenase [Psychromonas sp.]|jgi:D-3-phosphoglycerate dehydrogenase
MKILANDGISQEGISALQKAGYSVITDKVNQADLIQAINKENYEIVLVRSATTVRKEVIDACPGLKLVGRGGVGMDNIDVDYARQKGVNVINTPGASSQSVAELVMGQLFAISRSLHNSFKNMEEGDFNVLKKKYAKGVELRGKTLGIIGLGRIGQSLASYAISCGMNVIALGKFEEKVIVSLPKMQGVDGPKIELTVHTNIIDYLPQLDFISLHVPKQESGDAVIGKAEFDAMKDGVRIANASRGGVIDEDALLAALASGKVAAIALDVYENEPNPRKELISHPSIAPTPHIGAATVEAQARIGEELAESIIAKFGKF